jgi:predicted TPR repeat methyltransferase
MSWRAALPRVGLPEASELPALVLAQSLASAGERVAALEAYRELLRITPDDLGALEALAAVLGRLGRDAEGLAIHERIAVIVVARMGLALEDRGAALVFERAVAGLGPAPAEMPGGYTAALFDAYAPAFEARLRGVLRYRAPEQIHAALVTALGARAPGAGVLDVCDVGCGTGLLGSLLRPLARRLDGIDRSAGMLERAKDLGVYDDLAAADLATALTGRPAAYDVITAADVFVYIGDIAPALVAMAGALRPGGLAAFSVERTEEVGYQLQGSGRYQHAPAFVREAAAAAGMGEVSVGEVVLRVEQAQPVAGQVWVWRTGLA